MELRTYIKNLYCYKKLTQELESEFEKTGIQENRMSKSRYIITRNKKQHFYEFFSTDFDPYQIIKINAN